MLGGLIAAVLWATATLCSSRSSRMIGSRVVLAWVMIVGAVLGLPIALLSPPDHAVDPGMYGLVLLAGACYSIGLQAAYAALRTGKVSLVAPIVATEGAIAAVIAIILGDPLTLAVAITLGGIVVGVVFSALEPGRSDVAAGDFDITADALEAPDDAPAVVDDPKATRRTVLLAILSACVFGVGLVATGRAAQELPVSWISVGTRLVGVVAVALPLILARRLTITRAALPLILIAGAGELFGSMASAWGSRENIAIAAVMGSQFAAIAAVAAFVLFRERLGRLQIVGVVIIAVGVTVLAYLQA
jgi:drug/metabolite transporter (DMT)-like permease